VRTHRALNEGEGRPAPAVLTGGPDLADEEGTDLRRKPLNEGPNEDRRVDLPANLDAAIVPPVPAPDEGPRVDRGPAPGPHGPHQVLELAEALEVATIRFQNPRWDRRDLKKVLKSGIDKICVPDVFQTHEGGLWRGGCIVLLAPVDTFDE
jgi:hypothetical protein